MEQNDKLEILQAIERLNRKIDEQTKEIKNEITKTNKAHGKNHPVPAFPPVSGTGPPSPPPSPVPACCGGSGKRRRRFGSVPGETQTDAGTPIPAGER